MMLLILSVLAYTFSPQDSCRKLVTLGAVPERALLFAELAAGEGGQEMIDMGKLLEVSGRFSDAACYYRAVAGVCPDPGLLGWLADRRKGSTLLDTTLVLNSFVTNHGTDTVRDLTLIVPIPVSHPPYQMIEITGGDFHENGSLLSCSIDSLEGGETHTAVIQLNIRQEPYTFRPIIEPIAGAELSDISSIMKQIHIPDEYSGNGPCLDMSYSLRDLADNLNLDLGIVGGLIRRGDSLVFHAWTVLEIGIPGMPLDPLLFKTDSLLAVGHCPTDVIPLWDLLLTDGSELSVMYPSQDADLIIGMSAVFAP